MNHRFRSSILLLFLSLDAYAAKLSSYCYLPDLPNAKIQGENFNKKLPIASVSKIMTSYWSLKMAHADYKFPTKIYAQEAKRAGEFNIHIEGSRDPYFGKESLFYVISKLNEKGIEKIDRLTFDENFKFFWNITAKDVAQGHYSTNAPSPDEVTGQLNKLKNPKNLTREYKGIYKYLASVGIKLSPRVDLKVRNISFVSKKAMDLSDYQEYAPMLSTPLHVLLKEMNRNSNNHAANQIFEFFGGAQRFMPFINRTLGLKSRDIEFHNGSGDRLDSNAGAAYNSATCSAVLKIMKSLKDTLHEQHLDMEDIMPVAGMEQNTLERFSNDTTENSLVGKTGSVSQARTLAGLLSTKNGNIFFMYNYMINGTNADRLRATKAILKHITSLIKANGGGTDINPEHVKFISFDDDSFSNLPLTSGNAALP